jgi:hypothetical protein
MNGTETRAKLRKRVEQEAAVTAQLDATYVATELARQKLRTEVEFCRRQLAEPGKWKPEELIAWAAEKLAAAMNIEPVQ